MGLHVSCGLHPGCNATLHESIQDRITLPINHGVAAWKYMFIDRPGIYSLLFSSTMDIEWPFIISHRLTVEVCANSDAPRE